MSAPRPARRRPRRRWLSLLWQLGITAAFVVGAVLTVDLDMLLEAMRGVNWWLLLPGLSLFTVAKFIDAYDGK